MNFFDSADPFLFQLVILPFVVIGLGVAASLITGKIFIGPFVTLLLNLAFETWYFTSYDFDAGLYYSPWNLILPAISLVFCWIVVSVRKQIINVRQADA